VTGIRPIDSRGGLLKGRREDRGAVGPYGNFKPFSERRGGRYDWTDPTKINSVLERNCQGYESSLTVTFS